MRLIVLLVPLLCVLCAACATSSTQNEAQASTTAATAAATRRASTEAEPELSTLTFAWPVGASAVVTEEVLKKGKTAKLSYRIDVGAREGGGVTVQIKDLKFLEIQGIDIADPKAAEVIASLERQATAAMPAFLVSATGAFEDITDYDRLIELGVRQEPENRRANMRKTLKDPAMRTVLRGAISKIWRAWAGVWAGQGFAEGYVIEVEMLTVVDGTTYTIPARFEHKGQAPDLPGHVELAFTMTVEGEAGKAAVRATMAGAMGAIAEQDPSGAQEMEKALRDMSMSSVTTIHATVDASTLLPLRSESKEATTVVIDGEPHETLERHSYEFVWTLPQK